jgi:hypothetical protein
MDADLRAKDARIAELELEVEGLRNLVAISSEKIVEMLVAARLAAKLPDLR